MDYAQSVTASIDAAFANFGIAAAYHRRIAIEPEAFAPALGVTLIPSIGDAETPGWGGTTLKTDRNLFEVRVAEIAVLSEHDRMVINGAPYRVAGAPRRADRRGLKWTFGCRPERTET
jgi:hypothetical protein